MIDRLTAGGPAALHELLTATKTDLLSLLHAVRMLQKFRFIEYTEESQTVQLTEAGARMATAIKGRDIRADAEELLQE